MDGLKIGGVSGVIGNIEKPYRMTRDDFLAALQVVLAAKPKLMVLHQGPDGGQADYPGDRDIRNVITQSGWHGLVLCGHEHWNEFHHRLSPGVEIMNLDGRTVLATRNLSPARESKQ